MRRFELPAAAVAFALALAFGAASSGCTPSIGDKCVLSTDCSLRGDRMCDTSQPGGYCTIKDCRTNGCPDDGACVLFEPTVPGCGFDDRSPSRVGRPYCMAACEVDADCRGGDYICADPKQAPWSAVVLDQTTSKRVCIIRPTTTGSSSVSTAGAGVCRPYADGGTIDAHSVYGTSEAGAKDGSITDAGTPDADAGSVTDADAGAIRDAAEGG